MSEVKWIKITTNIFDDEKIQLIESMPDSDTIIVIWFKLLALAGKSNNGGLVMFNEKIPYTKEMLYTLFRRKQATIDLSLITFENFGMIEILDNETILISNWEKHQSEDKLLKLREGQRKRQKAYRDRQQEKLSLHNSLHNGNALDTSNNLNSNNLESNSSKKEQIPYKEIIEYLNLRSGSNYKHTTKKTQTLIQARWNEGFKLEDFYKAVDNSRAFWLSKGTDLTNMKPTTLFNGNFENRVLGSNYNTVVKNNAPVSVKNELRDQYE